MTVCTLERAAHCFKRRSRLALSGIAVREGDSNALCLCLRVPRPGVTSSSSTALGCGYAFGNILSRTRAPRVLNEKI